MNEEASDNGKQHLHNDLVQDYSYGGEEVDN